MAQILDETPRARRGKYHFANYNDGNWWLLNRGEDFPEDEGPLQVREAAKAWSRRRGLNLRTRKIGERQLALRFFANE